MKKLPPHAIRAPCGGPFWSNPWLPTSQIWADQNNFGSMLCKKLLWTKIGIVSFGPLAHSHWLKYS